MFVSLNIVKGKNRAVAGRQLTNCFVQRDAIHDWHRIRVLCAFHNLDRRFAVVSCLFHLDAAFAEVHQDLIDGQTVQPGGKGRLTTKASNFSKELNEDLLRQVFSLRNVAGHSQTERINPTIVSLVKLLEGSHVALSRLLSQLIIRLLLGFDFGCGHVFVLGPGDSRLSHHLAPVRHDYHASAYFKGAATSFSAFPFGTVRNMRKITVALVAGVMRGFERVVALPDPKDIEFPQPLQAFREL